MIWKKLLCVFLAFTLTVCTGCAIIGEDEAVTDQPSDTQGGTLTDDAERIAYYEALVEQLQSELLAVKSELFETKTEYEERIAELEASTSTTPEAIDFTYTVSENKVTVTAYSGSNVNVQIPSTIDGKPVTAVGDKAFLNNTTVQSVVIPEGVKTIGWFAFSGCIALGAVSMPSSVESISYGAFENCPQALTVFCPTGSYAESYARSYGIATAN